MQYDFSVLFLVLLTNLKNDLGGLIRFYTKKFYISCSHNEAMWWPFTYFLLKNFLLIKLTEKKFFIITLRCHLGAENSSAKFFFVSGCSVLGAGRCV